MAQGVEQVGAFHNNHCSNIVLLEEGTVAYRKAYYAGVVFTKYPINTGGLFEVKIEEMDTQLRWLDTLVSKNLESIMYSMIYAIQNTLGVKSGAKLEASYNG